MDRERNLSMQMRDVILRLERLQADVTRLSGQKLPDRFVPLQEATRYLYCGRDWIIAQIREGVLREGIDYIDRSSSQSSRRRYLVNPVSAQRWLTGADPAPVRGKVMTSFAAAKEVTDRRSIEDSSLYARDTSHFGGDPSA